MQSEQNLELGKQARQEELIRKREEFEVHYQAFLGMLLRYSLPERRLEKFKLGDDVSAVFGSESNWRKDKIIEAVNNLKEMAFEAEKYFHYMNCLKSIGEIDELKKFVSEYLQQYPARENKDYIQQIFFSYLEFCEPEKDIELLNTYTDYYIEQYPHQLDGLSFQNFFEERNRVISDNLQIYGEAYGLTLFSGRFPEINAAMELRGKYDLVVGVMTAGQPVAMLLETIGENVRYLEWHHDWEGEPVWQPVGMNQDAVTNAEKILVCENDAVTGATLKAIQPTLENLHPSQVDVSFLVDLHESNQSAMEQNPFYKQSYLRDEMPKKNFVKKLLAFSEILEDRVSSLKDRPEVD